MNLKPFYHFYSLNIAVSISINVLELKFALCILRVLLEEGLSQILNLGLSFYFMSKKGNFCSFLKTFFLDYIK